MNFIRCLYKFVMIGFYFLLFIFLLINGGESVWFCSATCNNNACLNSDFFQCTTSCPIGLMKDGPSFPTSCVAATYVNTSTSAKYALTGRTDDVIYNVQSTTTVANLTLSNSPTAICMNSSYFYQYYGNFYNTDVIILNHPVITDPLIRFWKIRIRGGVFLRDAWDSSSSLVIKFMNNISQSDFTVSFSTSNMDAQQYVCGSGQKQSFKAFQHEFSYNDSSSNFAFQIKVTGNTLTNPWGIRHFIVMARTCHAYCTQCFGDSSTTCTACDYTNMLTMLSNNTCALTCLTGYGFDSSDPDTCITCQANCSNCYDSDTNCTDCYAGYYLHNDGSTISCINPCPSHYYVNLTGIDHCEQCNANCQNCTTNSTRCTSCYTGDYLYNFQCYNPCPLQTYANTNTSCANCNNYCYTCSGSSNNCSVCDINGSFISYLLNISCLVDCGTGYFQDNNGGLGPNVCTVCDSQCVTCDQNATYCYSCNSGYYLLNNTCGSSCPTNYNPDNNTWTCIYVPPPSPSPPPTNQTATTPQPNLELINILTIALSASYLVIFLFCLICVSKLMAIQLIFVPQVTFAGLIMISSPNSLLSPLKYLFMTNGYNPLFTNNLRLPPNLSSLFFSSDFISNFNICLIVMLLPIPLGLILFVVGKVKQNQKYQMNSFKLLKEWFFTALLLFQFHATISLGINTQFGLLFSMDGYVGIGVFFIFVVYSVLLYKRPESFGEYKDYFKQDGVSNNFYVIICWFRIILAFILIFLGSKDVTGLVSMAIILIFACLLYKFSPYQNNSRPFLNICIIFFVFVLIYIFKTTQQETAFTNNTSKIILVLNFLALIVNAGCVVGKILPKKNQSVSSQKQEQEQEIVDNRIHQENKQVKEQTKEQIKVQKTKSKKLPSLKKTAKTKNSSAFQPSFHNSQSKIEITHQQFMQNGIQQDQKNLGQLGNTIETLYKFSIAQKKPQPIINHFSFQTQIKKSIIQKYQLNGFEIGDQVIQAPKKIRKNLKRQARIIDQNQNNNPKQLDIINQSSIIKNNQNNSKQNNQENNLQKNDFIFSQEQQIQ